MLATKLRKNNVGSELKLRLSIDGKFSIIEFSNLISSVNTIYNNSILLLDEIEFQENFEKRSQSGFIFESAANLLLVDDELYERPYTHINSKEEIEISVYNKLAQQSGFASEPTQKAIEKFERQLKIISINYNSAGKIDLTGIGTAIKSACDLIKYYFPNQLDRIKREQERQKLIDMRIATLKKIGFDNSRVKKIILKEEYAINTIEYSIIEKLLTNVDIVDE